VPFIGAINLTTGEDRYFSLEGLAVYASLSRRSLQDLVNDTTDPLPSYRIRGKIVVPKGDLDRWMTRRRNHKPWRPPDSRPLMSGPFWPCARIKRPDARPREGGPGEIDSEAEVPGGTRSE